MKRSVAKKPKCSHSQWDFQMLMHSPMQVAELRIRCFHCHCLASFEEVAQVADNKLSILIPFEFIQENPQRAQSKSPHKQ